jgi:hypothetical protein
MLRIVTSTDAAAAATLTRPRPATRDEVRAAILWAIDHDVVGLTIHREVAHQTVDELRRRRADAALVARWRRATAQL